MITFSEDLGAGAIVTVTTYAWVVPSSAVTVYVTDFVKSLAVEPLIWVIKPTLTLAFAEAVKVATNFVTSVPKGTVAVMFVPEIVAATTGVNPSKLNVLITFSEDLDIETIKLTFDNKLVQPFSVWVT